MNKGPTFTEISNALRAQAENFATDIVGQAPTLKTQNEIRFFKNGKLRVSISGRNRGSFIDFSEDVNGDMIDLYVFLTGTDKKEAIEYAKGWLGISDEKPLPELPKIDKEKEEKENLEKQQKRIKIANWLWETSSAGLSKNTIDYLNNRSITKKSTSCMRSRTLDKKGLEKLGIDTDALGTETLQALVFSATDEKNQIKAIQQILIHNGKKAKVDIPKITMGILNGSAVKLANPKDELALAEGPETGLSFWQATKIPTWIVLGSSNFTHVQIPEHVKKIYIAVDLEKEGNGLKAALKAACYWQEKNKEVFLVFPGDLEEGDFNDLLQKEKEQAILKALSQAFTTKNQEGYKLGTVICKNPWDALAIWKETGLKVQATIRDINPAMNMPEDQENIWFVEEPGSKPITKDKFSPKETREIRIIKTTKMTIREIFKTNPEKISELLKTAPLIGKETFYNIESLMLNESDTVILVQTRKAVDEAIKANMNSIILAYNANLPEDQTYDWSLLKDKKIYIAPFHCKAGIAHAAKAVKEIQKAGGKSVNIINWTIYTPGKEEGEFIVKYRRLPVKYDLTKAIEDGWKGKNFNHLIKNSITV